MDTQKEKRRSHRYEAKLPLLVTEVNGRPANWTAQTCDIGAGGVRFIAGKQLQVGSSIEYVITLSDYNPPASICCTGDVLRVNHHVTSAGNYYEVATTMRSYVFTRQQEMELAAV